MDENKIAHYRHKLTEERTLLESQLADLGRKNPDVPGDFEAQVKDTDTASTEPDEKADKFEEYEANSAVLNQLEERLRDVNRALGKIENGGFGICEISGEEIEEDRLEVNAAARTCKAHMEEEKNLPL